MSTRKNSPTSIHQGVSKRPRAGTTAPPGSVRNPLDTTIPVSIGWLRAAMANATTATGSRANYNAELAAHNGDGPVDMSVRRLVHFCNAFGVGTAIRRGPQASIDAWCAQRLARDLADPLAPAPCVLASFNALTPEARACCDIAKVVSRCEFPFQPRGFADRQWSIIVQTPDVTGTTALMYAARHRASDDCKAILDSFPETCGVSRVSKAGDTALIVAAIAGKLDFVELLVAACPRQCNPNHATPAGDTALSLLLEGEHWECARQVSTITTPSLRVVPRPHEHLVALARAAVQDRHMDTVSARHGLIQYLVAIMPRGGNYGHHSDAFADVFEHLDAMVSRKPTPEDQDEFFDDMAVLLRALVGVGAHDDRWTKGAGVTGFRDDLDPAAETTLAAHMAKYGDRFADLIGEMVHQGPDVCDMSVVSSTGWTPLMIALAHPRTTRAAVRALTAGGCDRCLVHHCVVGKRGTRQSALHLAIANVATQGNRDGDVLLHIASFRRAVGVPAVVRGEPDSLSRLVKLVDRVPVFNTTTINMALRMATVFGLRHWPYAVMLVAHVRTSDDTTRMLQVALLGYGEAAGDTRPQEGVHPGLHAQHCVSTAMWLLARPDTDPGLVEKAIDACPPSHMDGGLGRYGTGQLREVLVGAVTRGNDPLVRFLLSLPDRHVLGDVTSRWSLLLAIFGDNPTTCRDALLCDVVRRVLQGADRGSALADHMRARVAACLVRLDRNRAPGLRELVERAMQ